MGYKGIRKQMEESNSTLYEDLNLDKLEELLSDYGRREPMKRTSVLQTGPEGLKQFNQLFVLENIRETARHIGPRASDLFTVHNVFNKITANLEEIKREKPLLNINKIFKGLEKLHKDYEIQ